MDSNTKGQEETENKKDLDLVQLPHDPMEAILSYMMILSYATNTFNACAMFRCTCLAFRNFCCHHSARVYNQQLELWNHHLRGRQRIAPNEAFEYLKAIVCVTRWVPQGSRLLVKVWWWWQKCIADNAPYDSAMHRLWHVDNLFNMLWVAFENMHLFDIYSWNSGRTDSIDYMLTRWVDNWKSLINKQCDRFACVGRSETRKYTHDKQRCVVSAQGDHLNVYYLFGGVEQHLKPEVEGLDAITIAKFVEFLRDVGIPTRAS
jgi:hypothetical protein